MAQQTVVLDPGESQAVPFTFVPDVAKTYSVKVDGLAGSFVAKQPTPNIFCFHRFVHELPGYQNTTWITTEVEGRIGNLTKLGAGNALAGVEATFHVKTTGVQPITIEVLGWWQYGQYVTGVCIYDYNKTPPYQYDRYAVINSGEVYRYAIHLQSSQIVTRIKNPANAVIFQDIYPCSPIQFLTFQTELEYWRAPPLSFDGLSTIDAIYQDGVGWLVPADVCTFYFNNRCPVDQPCCEFLQTNHYAENGHWILEGKIRDGV